MKSHQFQFGSPAPPLDTAPAGSTLACHVVVGRHLIGVDQWRRPPSTGALA